MPASHVVAAPRGGVHRVGRGLDPFAFGPPPTPLPDAGEPVVGGNRFDDPAGRFTTLYAASSEEAAFGETIAAYRDRDGLLDRIDEFLNAAADPDHDPELRAGVVPPDYFADRYLGRAPVDASVRFVDLDHPETHAAAITPLRGLLRAHRLRTVDRGVLFHQDRRVTRPIARHFWALAQTADHRHWAGLRYASRLSGDWECWAIWEPSPIRSHATEIRAVTRSDPALVRAAVLLGISL